MFPFECISKVWYMVFYKEVVDLSHIEWESDDDISEDNEPIPCTEFEDTSVRHSINIYR